MIKYITILTKINFFIIINMVSVRNVAHLKQVVKTLYHNWNDKVLTGCIFVDFSKAFETIEHNILIDKLNCYGFENQSLKFMHHYVSARTQVTTVITIHLARVVLNVEPLRVRY